VNELNEFYGDVINHCVPSIIEEAKAQAEQDIKNKVTEDNKSKSKAASAGLPKEPKVEESKAASEVVPKSVNQVIRLKKMMEVGF